MSPLLPQRSTAVRCTRASPLPSAASPFQNFTFCFFADPSDPDDKSGFSTELRVFVEALLSRLSKSPSFVDPRPFLRPRLSANDIQGFSLPSRASRLARRLAAMLSATSFKLAVRFSPSPFRSLRLMPANRCMALWSDDSPSFPGAATPSLSCMRRRSVSTSLPEARAALRCIAEKSLFINKPAPKGLSCWRGWRGGGGAKSPRPGATAFASP